MLDFVRFFAVVSRKKKIKLSNFHNSFQRGFFSYCLFQSPVLRLRLKKPKSRKKVCWTTDTVDNEGMDKKKSKCESSSHVPFNIFQVLMKAASC